MAGRPKTRAKRAALSQGSRSTRKNTSVDYASLVAEVAEAARAVGLDQPNPGVARWEAGDRATYIRVYVSGRSGHVFGAREYIVEGLIAQNNRLRERINDHPRTDKGLVISVKKLLNMIKKWPAVSAGQANPRPARKNAGHPDLWGSTLPWEARPNGEFRLVAGDGSEHWLHLMSRATTGGRYKTDWAWSWSPTIGGRREYTSRIFPQMKIMRAAEQEILTKHGGAAKANPRALARKNPKRSSVSAADIQAAVLANADGGYLTDVARASALRGVHFKRILSAAEALAKAGKVSFDGVTISRRRKNSGELSDTDRQVIDAFLNQRKATGDTMRSTGQALTQGEDDLVAHWQNGKVVMAVGAGGLEGAARRYIRQAAPSGTLERGEDGGGGRSRGNPARKNTHLAKGQMVAMKILPTITGKVVKQGAKDTYDVQWTRSGVVQTGVEGSLLMRA